MKLLNLNDSNGDSKVLHTIHEKLLDKFPIEQLVGAEFGVAFGGGIQSICTTWGSRGIAYGVDTFKGHPKHQSSDITSLEAICMDGWYKQEGIDKITLEYITNSLLEQNISNFKLLPIEIKEGCQIDLPQRLHYVLLDLDIIAPMKASYNIIKERMIPGGYICVHDVIPNNHLPLINSWWYNEVMPLGLYKEVESGKFLGVYEVL